MYTPSHSAIERLERSSGEQAVAIAFDPPFPNALDLAEGSALIGRFTITSDPTLGTVQGDDRIARSGDAVDITTTPSGGWTPNERTWSVRFVDAVTRAFRTWPTTYAWHARIALAADGGPSMVSRGERVSARRSRDWRRRRHVQRPQRTSSVWPIQHGPGPACYGHPDDPRRRSQRRTECRAQHGHVRAVQHGRRAYRRRSMSPSGVTGALHVIQPHVRLGDPHVCSDDRHRLSLMHALYRPLVRRGGAGAYLPGAASRWRTSDDARRWTFELDPDATWADGPGLVAEDAAASLRRIRDEPPAGELGTSGVYQAYLRGARIEATGQRTLEVELPEPMADLLDVLVELMVLPERHLADAAAMPPGSGPYRLAERSDEGVVLEARDAAVATPRVHVRALADADARLAAVRSGHASIASDVAPRSTGVATHWQPSSVATTFMFDLTRGPCADVRVRRALNHAVDVAPLVEELFAGHADPTSSPCTPTQLGFDPELAPYVHDPDAARALLREAGHERLALTFDVPARLPDEAPRLAERLAEQFERVGVELRTVRHDDRPAYADMVREGRIHDAACFDSSPHSTFRLLREKFHAGARGPWWLGYTSVPFDALVDAAQRTPDLERRRATYRRAARLLHDDVPWLLLYGARLGWALADELAGRWRPTADGLIDFTQAWATA